MENSTFKETTIQDYIPKLKEMYPDIKEEDIKRIVEYGWRMIYMANVAGCDVLVTSQKHNFWFYIGALRKDPIKHFNYYRLKLMRKIRFLYYRLKPNWDGYYYLGITEEEAAPLLKKVGRKRVHFNFKNKLVFKSKDSSLLYYNNFPYIIRYKALVDLGFKRYYEDLAIDNPELVLEKKASTFEDILVINNDYDLI